MCTATSKNDSGATALVNPDLRGRELDVIGRLLGGDSPLLNPVQDLSMPAQAVGGLEDPMVLIGEIDQARRNALALENSEGGKTFSHGQTVVPVAVDDQGGGLPVLDKVGGVPALVVLTGLGVPWDTTVL